MKQSLDAWTEGYLSFLLEVQKKAPRTIVDVRCTLKRVMNILANFFPNIPLWQITLQQFLRWLELERIQGRSVASLSKDLSHLRGYLNFALRSGKSDRNVLDGFNLPDSKPEPIIPLFLELEEIRALIENLPRKSFVDRKHRIIILILYGCGLRTSELQFLNVQDVDLERQELFIRYGKGSRERRIPVPGGVWTELLIYLAQRGGKSGPLIKTDEKKRRISQSYILEAVHQAGIQANLTRHVFPKMLRHSFATHLMDRKVDVAVISTLMGHKSAKETGIYLHLLKGKKEEAISHLPFERGQAE